MQLGVWPRSRLSGQTAAFRPQSGPPEGLIHLDVAATDREGKPFSELARDFTLLDNGVPQKMVSCAASNEATDENGWLTEVVLALDEVNLSPVQFELVKEGHQGDCCGGKDSGQLYITSLHHGAN
jgi:hypothetical protein